MKFPDQYITKLDNAPKLKRVPIKIKILNFLANFKIVDEVFQKRAFDLIENTKIMKYIKNGGVYLDLGAGIGHIAEKIDEYADVNIIAIDPMWKPIKNVDKRLKNKGSNVTFLKSGGDKIPIVDNSLDGVALFFVLHHINFDVQEKLLGEIVRVLKKDCYLFLVEDVPASGDDKERILNWDSRHNFEGKNDEHFYRFDDEWQSLVQKSGFEIIENIYFEDISSKKDEGVIPHRCYILKSNKYSQQIAKSEPNPVIHKLATKQPNKKTDQKDKIAANSKR